MPRRMVLPSSTSAYPALIKQQSLQTVGQGGFAGAGHADEHNGGGFLAVARAAFFLANVQIVAFRDFLLWAPNPG